MLRKVINLALKYLLEKDDQEFHSLMTLYYEKNPLL